MKLVFILFDSLNAIFPPMVGNQYPKFSTAFREGSDIQQTLCWKFTMYASSSGYAYWTLSFYTEVGGHWSL